MSLHSRAALCRGWLVFASLVACDTDRGRTHDGPPPSSQPILSLSPNAALDAGLLSESVKAEADAGELAAHSICGTDMVLVSGNFCPEVFQYCIRHHPEYLKDNSVSERCMEFQAPARCLSKERQPLRFCIDRYEWPNKKREKPQVLVQWSEAKQSCERAGKRLCNEDEWLFACEGEEMLPHVYGFTRDPAKCQIDRPYRKRETGLKRYDACMRDPECKKEFDKLDQREPIGSFDQCVSPFGAYDMNGSVNEWVNVPGRKHPNRSGLKGGWWGPVRCRCRPTVLFHKEDDWGYEAGFRCCRDAPKAE